MFQKRLFEVTYSDLSISNYTNNVNFHSKADYFQ